jgi:hypothetical protein
MRMATVSVRYIVGDVDAAVAFCTNHLGSAQELFEPILPEAKLG